MPNEAAKLLVSDYLKADGAVRVDSTVRAEIAFNGKPRPLVWANEQTCRAIDDYLAYRLAARHGVTTAPAAYRGLDPHGPLFLTGDGAPFAFTKRITGAGAISYSCESLTEIVRRLHQQAGIEGGNASAARRTFAVRLHRDGRSLKLIQELIGVSSLSAVKNLVEGDPMRLSAIVRGGSDGHGAIVNPFAARVFEERDSAARDDSCKLCSANQRAGEDARQVACAYGDK